MPLYEFLRLAIEKLESSQHKQCSVDPPSETENDLFEGVKATQGQQQQQQPPDVVATSPTRLSLLPDTPSICDDATLLGNSTTATTGKCGGVEYIFNDISPELDLSQKDETFPWLTYPGDDDDNDNDDTNSLQDYSSGFLPQAQASCVSANKMLMSQKNGRRTCDQTALTNLDNSLQGAVEFSSFKARRLHHTFHPSLDVDSCVPVAPTALHSTQLLARELPKELFLDGRTKNMRRRLDTFVKTRKCVDGDTTVESIVASSSESSGNSAGRVLPYTKRILSRDNEESECQSDEMRNESVGLKKPSAAEGGSGSKRRRVAEVHNLSERRRRDRINQKMHALQELIPNCNKTDKASMLDEAVEYIKNLKHQVQIMSMGSGVLMFPAGSGHMYHAPMPHLSYMGARMGMSACFGNTNMGLGYPHCPAVFQGPHLFPITGLGYHQTNSVMGSSAFRVPSHNGAPSTSSKSNAEKLITNKIPQSSLINCTSSQMQMQMQMQARNEVGNESGEVDERERGAMKKLL